VKPHGVIKAGPDNFVGMIIYRMGSQANRHQRFVRDKGEQGAVNNRIVANSCVKLKPKSGNRVIRSGG